MNSGIARSLTQSGQQLAQQFETWLTPANRDAIAARFWAKVDVRGPDECWPWKAVRNRGGYGMFYAAGFLRPANRVALMLSMPEPLDKKLVACHRCDNPPCCNPAHLWPDTYRNNLLDAQKKGRHRSTPYASRPKRKLT